MAEKDIRLSPAMVKELERVLSAGNSAELAVRNGAVVLWAVKSKKKHEQPIA